MGWNHEFDLSLREFSTMSSLACHVSEPKVDMPNFSIAIIHTPIFGEHVLMCGSKNGDQKDMCLKDIELCIQNEFIIQHSERGPI